jgi:F0F1-type ATP synthase beta subunit
MFRLQTRWWFSADTDWKTGWSPEQAFHMVGTIEDAKAKARLLQ